jgi:hypothetical protein
MIADPTDVLIPYEGKDKFEEKVDARIKILERMLPRIEIANCTKDPEILLQIASECEQATLYYLAEQYRTRAGKSTPKDDKFGRLEKAIAFIEEHHRVTSRQICHFLGLSRHQFEDVSKNLKRSSKIAMMGNDFVARSDILLYADEEPVVRHIRSYKGNFQHPDENGQLDLMPIRTA